MAKYKKVRFLVAFGDVRGFSDFSNRIDDPEADLIPFYEKFDALLDGFRRSSRYFVKDGLGDGIMLGVELSSGHACGTAASFFIQMLELQARVTHFIQGWRYPRPDGFRIRVACGHVIRKTNDVTDYRGRACNLAHKLLRVEPQQSVLVHESAAQLLTASQAKRSGLRLRRVSCNEAAPRGVYPEDMSALSALTWAKMR